MKLFLMDNCYAICEIAYNFLEKKKYCLIWQIYAPKRGRELYKIIEKEMKENGIDKIAFWTNEVKKFERLFKNKVNLKIKLGFFEKELI